MTVILTGRIKYLHNEQRWGLVEHQEQTYYFSDGRFTGLGFDALELNQIVAFQGFTKNDKGWVTHIAQPEEPATTATPARVQSNITHLNHEKKVGFIGRLSAGESKDFFFNQAALEGIAFDALNIGDAVEFAIFEQDGKRYAKNVVRLQTVSTTAASAHLNSKDVDIPLFTQEIVSLLAKQIKQVSTLPFVFEDYTAFLLKLMGIPDVHPVPRTNAGGMFDGLFKLQGVEIMYDCTLKSQFEDFKKEQIDNYINKIKQSSITINARTVSLNASATKQIWVITNGSRSRILQCVDDIYVKEVCINDLLGILEKRMNHSYTSLELASRLRELGQENN